LKTTDKISGLTLMEMMMVIAIIGVLCAIATPNIIKWLPKHRVGSAAREVMATLEYARINAIKANEAVTVSFNWFPPRVTVADSGGTTLRSRRLPDDVNFYNLNLGLSVTFNGHGFSSQSGGVAVENVNNAAIQRIIKLTLGGNVSIE